MLISDRKDAWRPARLAGLLLAPCLLAGLAMPIAPPLEKDPASLTVSPGFCAAQAAEKPAPKGLYRGQRSLQGKKALPAPGGEVDMQRAVEHALRFNPSLGAEQAQSKASEEGQKSARGAFGPRLGMSYTANKRYAKSEPVSSRLPELGSYSLGIEISQPVFQGFRLLANYQKAALKAESDKASLRRAELAMTEQVQTYFLAYLKAGEDAESLRDSLDRLRDQLKITQAFYDVGLRPRLDVLQAEVNVSQAEDNLIRSANTRDTALAMLNTLLGLSASAKVHYTGKLSHVPFRRTLEQCLEAAYRQRPDLYIAAKSVEIARKDQKAVQADYYPQIDAYYNVTNSGNTPDLQMDGKNGSRSSNWEVGARATWNVFQWGTTHYADKQAGWLVTKMRHEEENLKLNVGYDIKSKLLAVREAEKRIHVAEKGVEQAREAYNVALARYQEQVGTNFEVLDASTKLTTAQASLTTARADYLTALAQIYVAMGEYHPDLLKR